MHSSYSQVAISSSCVSKSINPKLYGAMSYLFAVVRYQYVITWENCYRSELLLAS